MITQFPQLNMTYQPATGVQRIRRGGLALLFLCALTACSHGETKATGDASSTSPNGLSTPMPVKDQLGALDSKTQKLVVVAVDDSAQATVAGISNAWPSLRSQLVGLGARRNDLIAVDSALHSLESAISSQKSYVRAANGLTAAFAPLYATAGDKVPAPMHRLEYLQRSLTIDVSEADWVRANNDSISARSAWRKVRETGERYHAVPQFQRYGRALDAIEDAILSRNPVRFGTAVTQADTSLAAVEKAIDHQDPPWRRFFGKSGS